jgi:tetratricopeptide (TPR) repeat protein
MSRDDWYQNRTWSPETRAAFLVRARRSREHRFHYFVRQATVLREEGFHAEALALLDEIRSYEPKHHAQMRTELGRAQCLAKLGDHAAALEAFRTSFAIMRIFPHNRAGTEVAFAQYVVTHDRSDLFQELEETLREFSPMIITPTDAFYFNAACAFIFSAKGETRLAAEHAEKALTAERATTSGWHRHPSLGLVTNAPGGVIERLVTISAA